MGEAVDIDCDKRGDSIAAVVGAHQRREHWQTVILLGLLLTAVSCSAPQSSSIGRWSEPDELPILQMEPLDPVTLDSGNWHDSTKPGVLSGQLYWRAPSRLARSEPYAVDAEAVAAAKSWLVHHFKLSADELVVASVEHRSDGLWQAPAAYDGHTIELRQTFRGVPTDGLATVHLVGRDITRVFARFYNCRPVSGTSSRIVSRQVAVAKWRELFRDQFANEEELRAFGAEVSPRLQFVSRLHPESRGQRAVPVWVMMMDAPFMVDAHTGSWVNH